MRDNLKTPGPEAKFEAFSAHKEAFKPLPVKKRLNPSLVGGGRKVVAPSFTSSSAVNFDFHDSKPV